MKLEFISKYNKFEIKLSNNISIFMSILILKVQINYIPYIIKRNVLTFLKRINLKAIKSIE
jgi:hypothetical protein